MLTVIYDGATKLAFPKVYDRNLIMDGAKEFTIQVQRPDDHIKAPPHTKCGAPDMLGKRAQTLPMEVPYEIVRSFRPAFKQQLPGGDR